MCHRRDFDDVAEFHTLHQGHEVRAYEARVLDPPGLQHLIYTGDLENGEQVLVQVWPRDYAAQIAFRPERHDTWGPPMYLKASD